MKKYLLITTGGTISCVHSAQGLTPCLSGEEILRHAGLSADFLADMEFCPLASIDSTDMDREVLEKLLHTLKSAVQNSCGILILHGTDTLEFTAALVSSVFSDAPIPIVLTGSMLPLHVKDSDAPSNIRHALQFLQCGLAGPFVLFGDKIIPAEQAVKVYTDQATAFESANGAYAGILEDDLLHLSSRPLPAYPTLAFPQQLQAKVFLLKLMPFTNASELRFLTEHRYDGCVLSGFGAGGIPKRLAPLIQEASRQGVVFVMTSQCLHGKIDFSLYETGSTAQQLQIIPAGDMTDACAVARLTVLLSESRDHTFIQRFMTC